MGKVRRRVHGANPPVRRMTRLVVVGVMECSRITPQHICNFQSATGPRTSGLDLLGAKSGPFGLSSAFAGRVLPAHLKVGRFQVGRRYQFLCVLDAVRPAQVGEGVEPPTCRWVLNGLPFGCVGSVCRTHLFGPARMGQCCAARRQSLISHSSTPASRSTRDSKAFLLPSICIRVFGGLSPL